MTETAYVTKRVIRPGQLFKGNLPILSALDIELTERCNNGCVHCYINLPINDERAKNRELTTEEWKEILKQSAELGVLSVRFSGGEPLLRDDFKEIYLHARRLGLKVIVYTNACLITPELVDLLLKVPPLMKLEVSVYGMRAESYKAVTGNEEGFTTFQRGISLLIDKKIPFLVKSVLLPGNRHEKEEFEKWATTIPWMEQAPEYSILLDYRTRRDSPGKNKLIARMRLSPEESLAFLTKNKNQYIHDMTEFCAHFLGPQGNILFNCGAGEKPCVDAYGILQMCMLLRHPDCVYDLKQGSLRIGLSEVFPRIREMKATNQEYLHRCARCFLKGMCEQCPAKSWSEHGTLDTPLEYLCQVAHTQARFLGLLKEGEHAWEIEEWGERILILGKNHPSMI